MSTLFGSVGYGGRTKQEERSYINILVLGDGMFFLFCFSDLQLSGLFGNTVSLRCHC